MPDLTPAWVYFGAGVIVGHASAIAIDLIVERVFRSRFERSNHD